MRSEKLNGGTDVGGGEEAVARVAASVVEVLVRDLGAGAAPACIRSFPPSRSLRPPKFRRPLKFSVSAANEIRRINSG